MGWQPTFRSEGRIYANYIQASYPDRKIAVLWQNDQFGRDLFRGSQEGLGDTAGMIVADIAFDVSDDASIEGSLDPQEFRRRGLRLSTARRRSRPGRSA